MTFESEFTLAVVGSVILSALLLFLWLRPKSTRLNLDGVAPRQPQEHGTCTTDYVIRYVTIPDPRTAPKPSAPKKKAKKRSGK